MWLKLFAVTLLCCCALNGSVLATNNAQALSGPIELNQPASSCGDQNLVRYSDLTKINLTGSLYVRLPATATPTAVYLYSQSLLGGNCNYIGSVYAKTTQWSYVESGINIPPNYSLIVQGEGVGAEAYAAAVEVLDLPSGGICQPEDTCNTTYDGYSGYIQPSLVSGSTDQIAVYLANPIKNLKYYRVNYYSDGSFLYTSKKLRPLNRNYLSGGSHSVLTQADFANGESFNTSQQINMGNDWTGSLFVKSTVYKHLGEASIFVFMGMFILLVFSSLAIARMIYKRHSYQIHHGLNHLDPNQLTVEELERKYEEDHTIIG